MIIPEVNHQALTPRIVTAMVQPRCCLKQAAETSESTVFFDTKSIHGNLTQTAFTFGKYCRTLEARRLLLKVS